MIRTSRVRQEAAMRHVLVIGLCVPLLALGRLDAQEPKLEVRSGGGEPVTGLSLSPDGKWLMTAHVDQQGFGSRFRLWDAATGRPVRGFSGALGVPAVAFSADGKQVLAGGERLVVFDPASGKVLHGGPEQFSGSTFFIPASEAARSGGDPSANKWCFSRGSCGFSRDGKFAVAVHEDGARVWELATGKVFGPVGGQVTAAVLSADGKRLVWGDARDATVLDWSARKVISRLPHDSAVTALCLSADETWLITGCLDAKVYLWDMTSGKLLRSFVGHAAADRQTRQLNRSREGIISVALSSDCKSLVTTGTDGKVIVWDPHSGKELRTFTPHDRHSLIVSSSLSADGRWLVTAEGSEDRYMVDRGKRPRDHGFKKADPAVLFGGFGWGSSTVCLWDVASGKMVRMFQGQPRQSSTALVLSGDGKLLATAGPDCTARVWDLTTGRQTAAIADHPRGLAWLAFGGDGRWLATQSYDNEKSNTRIWEVTTGKLVRDLGLINPNNKTIAARAHWFAFAVAAPGRDDRRGNSPLFRFDLIRNKIIPLNGPYSNDLVLSPDGKILLSSALVDVGDVDVKVWEVQSGKPIGSLEGVNEFGLNSNDSSVFSCDGRWVLSTALGNATIWDLESKTAVHSFRNVYSAALSGDKKRLAGRQKDGMVAVWELATRQRLSHFMGYRPDLHLFARPQELALSSDGKRLFAAGVDDADIRLHEADTGKVLCKLYMFPDGNWAVVDDQGHYDCGNDGESDFLFWVLEGEIQPLSRFRDGHYEPGLLKKYLGKVP
jgi:WD40 repeat protein